MSRLRALATGAAFALALGPVQPSAGQGQVAAPLEEVPYVKTPAPVVDAILQLAGLHAGDTLIDLGSGDGRIVIAAASRGARALGVEIDPALVELATRRALEAGLGENARFVQQDLFETDLRSASVLTLYLLPDVNLALRARILATLAPGARVVSHDWDMGDWRPDRTVSVAVPDKPVGREKSSRIHLWVVPARVEGRWLGRLEPGGAQVELVLEQRFQQVAASLRVGEGAAQPLTGGLDGARIELHAPQAPRLEARLRGTVAADRIEGEVAVGTGMHRFVAARTR